MKSGKSLLSSLTIVLLSVMIITFYGTTGNAAFDNEEITITGIYHQDEARQLLSMTNNLRITEGLPHLTYDYQLEESAKQRAAEIVLSFSHTRPIGSPFYSDDYDYTRGENIAKYYDTPRAAFAYFSGNTADSLQADLDNLMSDYYTAVGMACFEYEGNKYWVQEFSSVNSGHGSIYPDNSEKTLTLYYNDSCVSYSTSWENSRFDNCLLNCGIIGTTDVLPLCHVTKVIGDVEYDITDETQTEWEVYSGEENIEIDGLEIRFNQVGGASMLGSVIINGRSCHPNLLTASVIKCPISDDSVIVSSIPAQTWNAGSVEPPVSLSRFGEKLVEGVDYSVIYEYETSVGEGHFTIYGEGDYYSGSREITFDVLPEDISNVTITGVYNQIYTGSPITMNTIELTLNGKRIESRHFSMRFSNNTDAGTATITFTGSGPLTGTTTRTFRINRASIDDCYCRFGSNSYAYTGAPIVPDISLSYRGESLVEGTDYTLSISNNVNVGTAEVVVTGIGNYSGTATYHFDIDAHDIERTNISYATVSGNTRYEYTGYPVCPDLTLYLDGYVLIEGEDYTTSYTDNTGAGIGRATITGIGDYEGTITYSFIIIESSDSGDEPTEIPVEPTNSGIEGFAERLYTCALARDFDEAGKNYWIGQLRNGVSGADAARSFLFSPEVESANLSNYEFVCRVYLTLLDRYPAAEEIAFWSELLMYGNPREVVFEGFVNSTEWANVCLSYGIRSGGMGVATITVEPSQAILDFATRLYTTCLGREADEAGLQWWANELANLRTTGSSAAQSYFFSEEFKNSNVNNREFVNRLYLTFMNRNASESEFDYWLGEMRNGMTRETVFSGFALSEEFGNICAEYGIIR